jgi:TolB-like protein
VRDEIRDKLDFAFDDMGEQNLKNITRPMRVFAVNIGTRTSRPTEAGTRAIGPMTEPAPPALPDKPSIAVLPFQNMSGDPEQEYFADGMVEEIITALSRIGWLFVIARNSSFTYKGKAVDIKQVGRELGVRYALEGSVRKAANRARITAQLIDAMNGVHLWANRFEGSLEDIFDLQDQVAASVVGTCAVSRRCTRSLPAAASRSRKRCSCSTAPSNSTASSLRPTAWRRGAMSCAKTMDGLPLTPRSALNLGGWRARRFGSPKTTPLHCTRADSH